MKSTQVVKVPNIGDFEQVEVIDVLVRAGDVIERETPLISIESDKATLDIPAPASGTVISVRVEVGDRVSAGDAILVLETAGQQEPAAAVAETGSLQSSPVAEANAAAIPGPAVHAAGNDLDTDLLVLGSGPGGYTAAFRAADLGVSTLLVEKYDTLGGVCLNVGCIPSKALLHVARVIGETRELAAFGVRFGEPDIDLDRLRSWKCRVLGQLTRGLKGLAKQRGVRTVQGWGEFIDPNRIRVRGAQGEQLIGFRQAIIAVGSRAVALPGLPADPRIMDSTGALDLADVPRRLLVIGGGIIGLEMAMVYHHLGSEVTVVELLDTLMTGADPDLVKPLQRYIEKQYQAIYLATRVTGVTATADALEVSFLGGKAPERAAFDRILVAAGRRPNGARIGAEQAGVTVDGAGFIRVNEQQRTNVPHIFAIGDVTGEPMLAHKATHEGKVAAEVAAGGKSGFSGRVIPAVAYTDPEVAWVGVTETMAREQGIHYDKGVFPWAASGRALSLGRGEGLTKLLFDVETGRVIGAGIVGPHAGDLIAEAALAIEMGCDAEDIGLTIHPHPTLSETIAFSAEAALGTITDLYLPKN